MTQVRNIEIDMVETKITREVLENKILKGYDLQRLTMMYVPIYLIEIEAQFKILFQKTRKDGVWAFDSINQSFQTISRHAKTKSTIITDGIILNSLISPSDSEEKAKKETIDKKFNFLQHPKFLRASYIKTIYTPYYAVVYHKGKAKKFDLFDAFTGEVNLLLKERMQQLN